MALWHELLNTWEGDVVDDVEHLLNGNDVLLVIVVGMASVACRSNLVSRAVLPCCCPAASWSIVQILSADGR